jgi:hypothetical protein
MFGEKGCYHLAGTAVESYPISSKLSLNCTISRSTALRSHMLICVHCKYLTLYLVIVDITKYAPKIHWLLKSMYNSNNCKLFLTMDDGHNAP